jgi:Rieske 2Fe-2S family protein
MEAGPESRGAVLSKLIARRKAGFSLERDFYADESVYGVDVERIWRRGWLFAGHSCEIPNPGDYVSLEVDADSILLIRGDDHQLRGLHNVCRHRGSLICSEASGHVSRLVCPYHQWTYDRSGALVACRGALGDFDKTQFGLRSVHAREIEGLIYVSLAEQPADFAPALEVLSALAKPQGLARAKVAATIDYAVRANWKLVWENNRECYHCNANHPQYIRANFDHYNTDDTSPRIQKEMEIAVRRSERKWAASGLAATHKQTGMTRFPDAENDIWFSANRTPLVEGYLSETMDGKQVAPLMGDYAEADVGTLRIRTLPNFWNHSSCDHAVSTRLLPGGPQLTRVRVTWLVHQNAVEGKDYQLEKLLPFWQLTSEQDWEICERQQRGVNSSAYVPGPYSPFKEYNVESFVRWYLKLLAPDASCVKRKT